MKLLTFLFLISLGAAMPGRIQALGDTNTPPTQLPGAMHVEMANRPVIKVGVAAGDMIGSDNRALQAAVDYVAGLGGGTVEIGPGEYLMRDSLHLRSQVLVRGTAGKTVLRKARAAASRLKLDGDFGEEQITVENPDGFKVGDGVAVWDKNANGFHLTVARITGASGNTFSINVPLNSDCMVERDAQAATVFPVVSGYHLEGVKVQDLMIEGNSSANSSLDGCRGGGIFLYRCPGAVIERCIVRDYNGDGISFQQSNDVQVFGCICENNLNLGLHPGSGSQRPTVRECIARGNGGDGLFLCWRVKGGLFEGNRLEGNRGAGISIGHKDTDNVLCNNQVRSNSQAGILFRNETEGMAGHRNRLERNLIENNGIDRDAAGILVRGETRDLVLKNNTVRDTRTAGARKQKTGIRLEQKVGLITLEDNQVEADNPVDDQRKPGVVK